MLLRDNKDCVLWQDFTEEKVQVMSLYGQF